MATPTISNAFFAIARLTTETDTAQVSSRWLADQAGEDAALALKLARERGVGNGSVGGPVVFG
jgi:hypothetical protein